MPKKLIAAVALLAIAAGAGLALLQRPEAPRASFVALKLTSTTLLRRSAVEKLPPDATSCVTCMMEMPQMAETWRRFAPRGYERVAAAMRHDHPNAVAAFAQKHALGEST